ncbi:MAG: hypothetical protein IJD80_03075, partial [Oscillospiraceae bacterium]|nr:hypothetical protein [Oscillospiraceae bacterium]
IFARDGYLYHYFNGAPPGMEEDVAAVLYQYDTNGNLLQVCKIGADVELDMNSAVVSDGRCLYFSGREAVCENGKPAERISHIFAIDQENMEIKKVYTPHQATVDIISGYKGSLVAEFEYPGKDKNGDVQFRSRVELLDMKTLERKPLFTTTNLWYNLCEGKLYNPYDVDGGIKIYDLENRKETTVILTDDTEMLKNGHISVNFITDRYVFLSVEYYGNMLTENYIYDFETDGLSPAPDFCGMPCLYPEDSGYYIVQTGEQKVSVSEGFYSVTDIYYSLITPDDYHNGNENLMPIKNEIEYR